MPIALDHGTDLFRIVYASRALIQQGRGFESLVDEVIRVSEHKNAQIDVTGLLLAHQGWFLQAIEGPRRRVSSLFGLIARDLRHNQVELISGKAAETRLFGRWAMCAQSLTPEVQPILEAVDLGVGMDPARLSSEKAVALLTAIAAVRRT